MPALTYASTFSGIEGFGLGFDRAGMRCTLQVEIDKHRRMILARHYPNVPRAEDICDVTGSDLGNPDVAVGGFPCKNLSIGKGHRTGLASSDSGLYWEFQRLVDEHLRLVDSARPRWAVLENVEGLLRFNDGRDMAAVLLGLEQLGYGWAYRLVDCRDFGSDQLRRRVIIVAHRGGDPRPAWQVLDDTGEGRAAAGLPGEPAGEVRPGDPGSDPGVRVFRKSANPQGRAVDGHYASYVASDYFNTLTSNDSGPNPVRQKHLVLYPDGRLRGLTPIEWERLQGFPDDWTAGIPDGQRYRALGDAMNVDLATWLGHRIVAVDAALPLLPVVA